MEPNAGVDTTTPCEEHRPVPDVENPKTPTPGVTSVLQRWRREDLLEKGRLVLRSLGCLFSMLSFIVMASAKHGGWMEFGNYQEFRYVVTIGSIGFLYSLAQVVLQAVQMNGGLRDLRSNRTWAVVDFAGDQVVAYLLLSALSSAIPMINRMRRGGDNIFTDSLSASVSMAFFAFLALALSSVISGYRLSKQSYI